MESTYRSIGTVAILLRTECFRCYSRKKSPACPSEWENALILRPLHTFIFVMKQFYRNLLEKKMEQNEGKEVLWESVVLSYL